MNKRLAIILFFLLGTVSAFADSEGPKSPTVATDEGDWVNPDSTYASDDKRARHADINGHKMYMYTFKFVNVEGTVDSIKVEGEGYGGTNKENDCTWALTKTGYSQSFGTRTQALGFPSETIQTIGDVDLWGTTWTPAEIQASTFGVLVRDADASPEALYIDHVKVTVFYTPAPEPPDTLESCSVDSCHNDYSGESDSVRFITVTGSQTTPDSVIITYDTLAYPDSSDDPYRIAIDYQQSHTDSSYAIMAIEYACSVYASFWVREGDLWSERKQRSRYFAEVVRHTIGRTTGDPAAVTDNCEDAIRGGYYVSDGNGTGDSLYFYLRSSGDHTPYVKGALYDGWLNLIDTTNERQLSLTSSYAWYGFALQNSPTIEEGVTYIFVVWGEKISPGYVYLGRVTAPSESRHYLAKTYDGWPDPLGGSSTSDNHYCYLVYTLSEPPTLAPLDCRVTTWYSQTYDPDGYGDCCPGAPCEDPRYTTYIHEENAGFSAVSRMDDVDSAWIQIDTIAADSQFWNSGAIEIAQIDSAERCEKILLDSAKTIQDGVHYHWRIKFWNSSGWSDWSADHVLVGVAPMQWWGPADTTIIGNDTTISYRYKKRKNIRADTSHSILYQGYTMPFEMQTGYGKVLYENALTGEGIAHESIQLAYYEGFSYVAYTGDSASGQGCIFVGKYDHGNQTWYGPYAVDTTSTSGVGVDYHYYPSLLIGEDEKLHLFRGGHDDQAYYYRTTGTHQAGTGIDIESWTSPYAIPACSLSTYIRPCLDTNGTIFLFFRHNSQIAGESKRAHWCYVKSTDNGANWGNRQHIVYYHDYIMDGGYPTPSVYCGGAVIDGNNRAHLVITWWESYGQSNLGRAISYMFSDFDEGSGEFKYWRELETTDTLGEVTENSPDADKNVDYAACSKVATCGDPNSNPITGPFVITNAQALAVYKHPDSNYYLPYFDYVPYTNYKMEETPLKFCQWNGSSWTITDLNSGITPNGPKIWNHRTGGQLVIDGNTIYVYGQAKPAGEEYFGGELVRWRGAELGTNWTWEYLSRNSGIGTGAFSVLPYVPAGQYRELIYCKGKEIVWMQDRHFPTMRSDGADIAVVQGYYNNNVVYWDTLDRVVSNAFQLNPSEILFSLQNANILANKRAPANRFHQVYWGYKNADPDDVKDDPDNVFSYYESFEAYNANSDINGQGGWVTFNGGASDTTFVFNTFNTDHWPSTGSHKCWAGDKFLYMEGDVGCKRSMGVDVTDVEVHCHIYTQSSDYNKAYVELKDLTADKYVRLGLVNSKDSAFYDLNGNTDTTALPIRQSQYYDFKFLVWYDSGVCGYVNDSLIFDWADTIIVFDSLKLYCYSETVFDNVTMQKWVLYSPSPALADGTDSIEQPRKRRLLPSYRGVR